jgi:hypothetical protein
VERISLPKKTYRRRSQPRFSMNPKPRTFKTRERLQPILSVFLPIARDKFPIAGISTVKMKPSLYGQSKIQPDNNSFCSNLDSFAVCVSLAEIMNVETVQVEVF